MADDVVDALLALPADVSAPAAARRALAPLAGDDPALCGSLALLATELVTNALRHGGLREGDRIEVRAHRTDGAVRVEVRDPGRSGGAPEIRQEARSLEGNGGLGLRLVDRMAHRWGTRRVPGYGTLAWFELRAGAA